MSEASRRVIFNMLPYGGMISKMNSYAEKIGMDANKAIDSLIGDWEDGEKGLKRSIKEGDFNAFLDEELTN